MRSLTVLLFLVLRVSSQKATPDDILNLEDGDLCPRGTWSASGEHYLEMEECDFCATGEANNEEGMDTCTQCTPGTYTDDLGYFECMPCPAGQINTEDGSDQCFDCEAGLYSPVEGGTSCDKCLPGHYQDETGAAGCKVCPAGTYQADPGAVSCDNCPAGTSSPVQSTTPDSCVECAAGSYSDSPGSECVLCPIGEYQDVTGATGCKSCPSNTDKEGATECSLACPEGQVPEDGVCKTCPAGSYAAIGDTTCSLCALGSYSNIAGAGACSLCPVKTYGPLVGLIECLPCEGNDEEGQSVCKIVCPAGEVVQDGACVPCPVGQYESEGQCLACAAGTYSSEAGSTSCPLCPAGHYSADEAAACTPCAAGQYQDKEGQAVCEDCAAGYYGEEVGLVACAKCAAGFYNPNQGQTSCSECPAGTITESEGQLACQECDAGSYSISSSQCADCPPGTFSDDMAAECTNCHAGTYAPYSASIHCSPADPGTYVDDEGATATKVCPAGSYCPEGTVSPIMCPAGIYCPEGSAEGIFCPVGTYNPLSGAQDNAACVPCTAGSYCAELGLTAPSGLCSAGYFCPAGSSSPTENISPAGHYAPEGSAHPTPCPKSTYNPNTGSASVTECVACPEGQETESEASTSADQCKDVNCVPGYFKDPVKGCQVCPRGEFSNVENAVACRKCPKGQYNSEEGAVQCMHCPVTAYTWSVGTASLDGCIGPVIEVCTGEDMTGNCYRYYDNNPAVNTTIKSVKVIRGEFELFDQANYKGYHTKLADRHPAHDVTEISRLNNVASFKVILNDVFCYLDQGWKYRGKVRKVSKSGKACLDWSKTPLAHKAAPGNSCQNPDGTNLARKPFCYVSSTETEECDIPACIWDMDCYTGNGVHYRGHKGHNLEDDDCQNWNKDFPIIHGYHSPEYAWAGVGTHTYCRNPSPGSENRPWCFRDNWWALFTTWAYCDIPQCSRDQFKFYKF